MRGRDMCRCRCIRVQNTRLGARLSRALHTAGIPDHGGADSGEAVWLCIASARHEPPLLPPIACGLPVFPTLAASGRRAVLLGHRQAALGEPCSELAGGADSVLEDGSVDLQATHVM